MFSGALALDHDGAVLLVLLLAHPHLLERAQAAQDAASQPRRELLFRAGMHLNLHVLGRNLCHLLLKPFLHLFHVRVSTSQNQVLEKVATNIYV